MTVSHLVEYHRICIVSVYKDIEVFQTLFIILKFVVGAAETQEGFLFLRVEG